MPLHEALRFPRDDVDLDLQFYLPPSIMHRFNNGTDNLPHVECNDTGKRIGRS
jgi:hypothetical protein